MISEYLTIGTVTCNSEAFKAVDLIPLLGSESRGSNRVLPGAFGQRPLTPVRDQVDVAVTWYADARYNPGGTLIGPGTGNLYTVLAYYKSAFLNQANATTGNVAGTLTLANGTVTANMQVWDWSPVWSGPMSATVVTRIVVPDGQWT